MSQLEYEWYVKAPVCEKLSFSSARNIKSSSKKMQTFFIFDFSSPFSHLSLVTLLPSVNVLIVGVCLVLVSAATPCGENKSIQVGQRENLRGERQEAYSLFLFQVLMNQVKGGPLLLYICISIIRCVLMHIRNKNTVCKECISVQ